MNSPNDNNRRNIQLGRGEKSRREKKREEEDEDEEAEDEDEDEEEEMREEENVAVVPPNGGWGWVVVFCAFYCNVIIDGVQLTFGTFLKSISQDLNADMSSVALAGSLMFGVHLLMGPICAGCNEVFGLRPVTITGSVISCFGIAMSFFTTNCWYLYFSFGLIGGMGLGLIYMNTLVITSLYFTTLVPVALGIVVCGTGVGTMVFSGVGHVLLKVTTWRYSFLIEAALVGTIGIAAITFRPLKAVKVKLSDETGTGEKRRRTRGSVFIKSEMPRTSIISTLGYNTIPWSLSNIEVEREEKTSRCSRCCRKKKKSPEINVLLLSELKDGEGYPRRKSYVVKMEEISPKGSVISQKSIFTRVDIRPKRSCWKTLKRTLSFTLDCRLLSSCPFVIFTISGGVGLAAYLIVFIYEKDRCEDLGFSEQTSTYFVIAIGASNMIWRLLLGVIAILPKVHVRALCISGLAIGGIAIMFSGYSSNIYYQFGFCILFGLSMSSYAVFRIPLTIYMVGEEFLQNATGINLLFMGICCSSFPPILGVVREAAKSFNIMFLITGALLMISGFMLIGLKKVDTGKIKRKR